MTAAVIFSSFSALVFLVVVLTLVRDAGYREGVKDGYKAGADDADKWWMSVAQVADSCSFRKENL